MNIYEEIGVRPLINALSTYTRLGGSIMPPAVIEAMREAAKVHVDLVDLQQRVGAEIARLTRNEAAYVSAGAAAGLALATAACVAGKDPHAIRQLPDTTGLKNEVIVHKAHRNGYDHAVRQVGVTLVEIGNSLGTAPSELQAAINARTAAVFWFQGAMTGRGDLPLAQVIEIAHAAGVPVVVDAAAQLPPPENLWYFTHLGADLAVFSGGKDLHGPQSAGLVLGKRELIEACAFHGNPNSAIGRPMKVGKEELVGVLAALRWYLNLDHTARGARFEQIVADWCAALNAIPGVTAQRSFPNGAGQPVPRAHVTLDPSRSGMTGTAVADQLRAGTPSIAIGPATEDGFYMNPYTLGDGEAEIVQQHVYACLSQTSVPVAA